MAITASEITTSNTLEQFRQQFNNLVTDVTGLESGTQTFTATTTTTSNVGNLNVLEDGTIVFEGATDDDHETTLTVVDPTADRTVSLPNASGTVIISDSSTNVTTLPDDLLIKDGGTIGNASVADVMTLASTGIVTFKDDILIKDGGTIGAASDADSITIASNGVVTFSQKDVHDASLSVKNGSTSAGFIEFFEDSDNGTNKVTLIGPASTSDVTLTLPSATDTLATSGDVTALAIALG